MNPLRLPRPLIASVLLVTAVLSVPLLLGRAPAQSEAPTTASTVLGDQRTPGDGEAVAYFAGGCFWCIESRFRAIDGVIDARSGYMGGDLANPTYEQVVCGVGGHRESVEVLFDPSVVSYQQLLDAFWRMHDPSDPGGSFVDRGHAYTSAIYTVDEGQWRLANGSKAALEASGKFDRPIATSIELAGPFWVAEAYHQDFAARNPVRYGYYAAASGRTTFIERVWASDTTVYALPEGGADGAALGSAATVAALGVERPAWWREVPSDAELRATLDSLTYRVVRQDGTERAFSHPYDALYEDGIYVDILSGEPLFSSTHKYDSGSGWPSFWQPIDPEFIVTKPDRTLWMVRTEVRSRFGDAHLGHVFDDGPAPSGQRWCINGVALRFVPLSEMAAEGYADFLYLFH